MIISFKLNKMWVIRFQSYIFNFDILDNVDKYNVKWKYFF